MDVIVVGGGVVGAASAVRLQAMGAKVTLIDAARSGADRASYGNATMIANELCEPLASWATARTAFRRLFAFGGPLDFVLRDVDLWAPWSFRFLVACRGAQYRRGATALDHLCRAALPAWRRLLDDVGRPDLLDLEPHWAVWETPATLQAGLAAAHAAATGPVEVRDLATQEVGVVQRAVAAPLAGGASFEGSARIRDPGAAVQALHDALSEGGGRIVRGEVETVQLHPTSAEVTVGGEVLMADHVLVAAGARSAPLVRSAGLTAPLIAERGYHLQYADHDVEPGLPALIFEDRFICVVRAGSDVRVTGFTEIGRPGSPPDPRKWAALERHVSQLGLPVRGAPDRWMGARPTLPDFLPAIGRKGRLIYAFGHQHIGLTLAAATAEAVVELAGGETPDRLHPFRLERFS